MISFSLSYWSEKQIQWTVIIRGDGCNSVPSRVNRSQSKAVIVQRPVAVWNLSQLQPIQSTLMNTWIETTEISNKAARTKQFLSISVTDGRGYLWPLSCRRLHFMSRTMGVLQCLCLHLYKFETNSHRCQHYLHKPVADPGFLRRRCQPLNLDQKPIIRYDFCQKLHENEKKLDGGGGERRVSLTPP